MKRNVMGLVAILGVGAVVTTAWAGCPEKCGKSGKAKAVTVSDDGRSETTKTTPCSGKVDKAPCGSKSATLTSGKAPCGKSKATTVADKAPCGSHAKTASTKAPCGSKTATLTSGKTPCGSKTATLTSGKAPCGKSKATTVADKAPCGSHAKTASTKAPCGSSTAKLTSGKAPCGKSKGAPCGSHAALTSSKGGCKVTEKVNVVLASMPDMKFKIGSDTTSCCQSAATLAKKHNKPIEYVVGETTFKTEGEATVYLASWVEKKVDEMKTVQFAAGKNCYGCPKTAAAEAKKAGAKVTYRVGGVDFADKEHAHKAAVLAKDKLGEIKMSYKVGKDTFCCDKMAGVQAKKTGGKMLYVVGEEETECDQEAKMLMAKAKLAAIIAAATAVLAS